MDGSLLLDETGRMLVVAGLICAVLPVPVMVVGLIVGVIQAATSISEQSLSFVPWLLALVLCIVVFRAAVVELLTSFTAELFGVIGRIGR
ncbi:MAG: flagellar biosynthetic protein FliQ [Sphingomonas sp.]|jgi:flagellar biosynthetic protein FliQ|uniref:flagellar biosynthetic protein FliQ n=1 Tax=Sphingomonas sp. TaxID=28214 RepID=UPI00334ED312